ncbi:MAG: hypothetical protein H6515_13170 [Microthrixaceae bacterium]|nr:hypothetical protein [Microthrixaceae bacterium]
MTGISDQFWTIGDESTYGTRATTLTRGVEQKPGNSASFRIEHRPSGGFRPGFLGDPTDTHVVDSSRGGTVPVVFDLLSKGHSMVLSSAGSVAITTPDGATLTRDHTITPSDGTLDPRTIHRAPFGAALDEQDFLGCTLMDLGFSVSPKGNVQVTANYDFASFDSEASTVTPTYPSSPYVFQDVDVTTSLGGSDICQRSIDFTIPTGAKVDLDRICPTGRAQPVVADTIRPTGSLSFDYGDESYLDDWIAGTSRALVFTISGAANGIETSFAYSCTVTFAAVKFTGSDLNMSLTDKTEQPLTWQAFDNGSDPLWQIVYRTTDTAI